MKVNIEIIKQDVVNIDIFLLKLHLLGFYIAAKVDGNMREISFEDFFIYQNIFYK